MKNITLSYAQQVWIIKMIGGIAWIFYGCTIWSDHFICNIISIIAPIVCILCICTVVFFQRESSDEMAEANLHKAQANVCTLLHVFLCLLIVISVAVPKLLPGVSVATITVPVGFVMLGLSEITVSLLFRKYERE